MRLSDAERAAIRQAARDTFSGNIRVLLFGSRTDDRLRGGDIDLLVEVPPEQETADLQFAFWDRLQQALGEQRIDILLVGRGRPLKRMEQTAYAAGVAV